MSRAQHQKAPATPCQVLLGPDVARVMRVFAGGSRPSASMSFTVPVRRYPCPLPFTLLPFRGSRNATMAS